MVESLLVRVTGLMACFSDPSKPAEKKSLSVPTPSALEGLLRSVHGKPEFKTVIEEVWVHNPVEYITETRREVKDLGVSSRMSSKNGVTVTVKNPALKPTLRQYTYLYDVDYTIKFRAVVQKGGDAHVIKHHRIFQRRVRKGQWFKPPVLGLSHCYAEVRPPVQGREPNPSLNMAVGMIPFGWFQVQKDTFAEGHTAVAPRIPIFFPAAVERGVMAIPTEYYKTTRPDWPLS